MNIEEIFEESHQAYNNKNYATAYEGFLKAAEHGHVRAACALGFMYNYGEGVEQNIDISEEWFIKSAEMGHVSAQYMLALIYYKIRNNISESLKYFRKAAEQGMVDAQYYLGIHQITCGVPWPQNESDKPTQMSPKEFYGQMEIEGLNWIKKAAIGGHCKAQFILGVAYQYGDRVEKNMTKAIKWYTAASNSTMNPPHPMSAVFIWHFVPLHTITPELAIQHLEMIQASQNQV